MRTKIRVWLERAAVLAAIMAALAIVGGAGFKW